MAKEEKQERTIDEALLKGISFTGANQEKQKDPESGRTRIVSTPFKRQATADDVLSFREDGSDMVIVLKDGMKYRVANKGAKKKAE
jgi:hypothetical protein